MKRALLFFSVLILLLLATVFASESIILWVEAVIPNRYRSSTRLRTATKRYSFTSDSSSGTSVYVPCDANCPWESYQSNEDFKANYDFRAPFSADDDKKVTAKKAQLACIPFSFGYSLEKGNQIFPPFEYPTCQSKVFEPQPIFNLDHDKEEFSMICPEDRSGKYVLKPAAVSQTDQLLYSQLDQFWSVSPYESVPRSNVTSEFALGSCARDYTQAQLIPKFNQSAFNRASLKMKQKTDLQPVRPMIVLFIAVDSFSRRHFYRKMNKTVQFFNELNAEGRFHVFDFKVHTIMGQGSPENMVPMFTNQTAKKYDYPPEKDVLGDFSLWSLFKELGYVTMLGFEDCDHHFPNYLGQHMNVDHLVRTFYCGTEKYFGVKMRLDIIEQRCIGSYMSQYYILNYTQTFSRIYSGANQFIYLHLDAAHEKSGQHAATLDPDLSLFLKEYLAEFDHNNDLAVFVQGDHGMRYGEWHTDIDAEQEHKLPAMFFITQSRLLDRLPYSYDSLWHNTFRLVSKHDFRATILALSEIPYGKMYPVHEEAYLSKAKILFREKIEDTRMCGDIGIQPWCCACLPAVDEIPSELIHSWGLGEVENLLVAVVKEALRLINEFEYTVNTIAAGLICQKLTFDYILQAYGSHLDRKSEQLQVVFTVNELETARIDITAIVSSDDSSEFMRRGDDWNPLDPFVYLGNKVNIRVRCM